MSTPGWSNERTGPLDPGYAGFQERHLGTVRVLLKALILALIVLISSRALLEGQDALTGRVGLLLLGMLVLFVLALARLYRGRLGQAVVLVVVAVMVMLAAETVADGVRGSSSFLFAYTVPIAFAGLLLGRLALILSGVASVVVLIVVHLLERAGVPWVGATVDPDRPAGTVVLFILIVTVLVLLLDRFAVELRAAHEVAVRRQGELAGLVGELERQAAENSRLLAEIRSLNEELERRVELRTVELSNAVGELETFAYSVSHDLRTPLRGIDGFGQALAEDYAGVLDENALEYIRRIRAGARRMGERIDDLLKLLRLSQGGLRESSVDLTALAWQVIGELRAEEPERQVLVDVTPEMRVTGDRSLLRIVLANLLENAWKFTASTERPRIEVGRIEQEGGPVYYVRDNGAGFDMRYADSLFVPFRRLHSPEQYSGAGMGLATAYRIVARHGGTIWAEGKVGEGSTFYFTVHRR